MPLGAEVKKARAALGLSQDEYAKRVKLPQQTISRIEAGDGAAMHSLVKLINRGGLVWTPRGPRAANGKA